MTLVFFINLNQGGHVRVYSMYDGCSMLQQSLLNIGITPKVYESVEKDKYASAVTRFLFPKTIQREDILDEDYHAIASGDEVTLLSAGFPCQSFSRCSPAKLNFEDDRGKLFFQVIEALKIIKPKYFLLENVVMKTEVMNEITRLVKSTRPEFEHHLLDPIKLDARDFSPQSRVRLYWTNIPYTKPEPLNMTFKDIRVHTNEEHYFYSDKYLRWIDAHSQRKNKQFRILDDQSIVQCIERSHHKNCSSQRFFGIRQDGRLRYITPEECELSQMLPSGYTSRGRWANGKEIKLSKTQRYMMIGNGFCVAVVESILRGLLTGGGRISKTQLFETNEGAVF
jgi:DNA (cytosine-5)-methyltransferase 3A|tara:strand:+ start:1382 stop:2395 length:1014 start_codon:yes stop_codon:yes gene_type:complete